MAARRSIRRGTRLWLAGLVCAIPVLAAGAGSARADGFLTRSDGDHARACGEDAFTFAEVVEQRPAPPRGTPLIAIPQTLCADLADDRRRSIGDIQVVIDPRERAERPRDPRREPRREPRW